MPPRRTSKTSRRPAPRRSYHHGDLERELLGAAMSIIEARGIEALTLRSVAQRAKVSHAAPYHHFANKAELLAGVAAAGYDGMVDAIGREIAAIRSADLLDRLRGVGRGYVRFAVERPTVFRLMFRPELTQPAKHPRLIEAEARAFGTLLETIVALQAKGQIAGKDPRPPAAFAWSAVHGLATLHIDEVLGETPLAQIKLDRLEAETIEAIIAGLQARRWK